MISQIPRIPDPETSKRLLANLRQTNLEIQDFNRKLDEINDKLVSNLEKQWSKRRGQMSNS